MKENPTKPDKTEEEWERRERMCVYYLPTIYRCIQHHQNHIKIGVKELILKGNHRNSNLDNHMLRLYTY